MHTSVKRILAGTDGSTAAARGVGWAAELAAALDADLVVTAVANASAGGRDVDAAAADRDRIADLVEGPWSEPARTTSARVSTLVLEGDPRVVLLDAVLAQDADLLVLGSAGTGWFPAMHLGHVAHAVAHHSPVPVAIVPPDSPSTSGRPILVGVDGSGGAANAVAWTAGLAAGMGAEVLAVHVDLHGSSRAPGGSTPDDGDDRSPLVEQTLDERCRQWTAPLRDAGVTTRTMVSNGWPATAIVDLEASASPGLVVLGARGSGGFKGLQLGSVALGVLQRSVVPVVIVPVGG